SRNTEKLLDVAQLSGILVATNRKLKDLDLSSDDYDLSDTLSVDFTGNFLCEVPMELYDWYCLRTVIMSRNYIKVIPDFLVRMKMLKVLDMSNNLLTHLHASVSELKSLAILKLSNNSIVSIPEEIGGLKQLEEFDISGNEIDRIPLQVGDMRSLLHLDVSKNNISILPDELSKLQLVHLDASSNKISSIPLCFEEITSLQRLLVHDNPLVSPPLKVLKKGKVHLFKSLQLEVAKKARSQENAFTTKKADDFVAQVSSALGVADALDAMANAIPDDTEIFVDTPVRNTSPVKTQSNGFITDSPTKRVESPAKKVSSPKQQSPKKKSPKKSSTKSPSKSPTKEIKSTRKQSLAEILIDKVKSDKENMNLVQDNVVKHKENNFNHNRRNSREPKPIVKSSFPGYTPQVSKDQKAKRLSSHEQPHFLEVIKPRTAHRKKHTDADQLSFTMRRKTEKIYEEMEMLESLRESIGSRLKMPLPPDLMPALADGVILCHLANHLKARSIPTIHVPSPAVPKLSMAKCRRNVDNFLDACRKLGVKPNFLCDVTDILHERNIPGVTECIKELLKLNKHKSPDHSTPP
uniref:Calponin-homology (CH) domain-containing protein n=1 Tax=Ciona savignyi TaxID=51511 RepID=H2Z790_CIOSA